MKRILLMMLLAGLVPAAGAEAQQNAGTLGEFEGQTDVGQVLHNGSVEYDASSKTYTVAGSGEDIWSVADGFHFVWKKISADDVALAADVSILTTEGNNHRKGVLMIRQSLESDSAYVDAARHGDGLTSLQFRTHKGAATSEVESNVSDPVKLRLEKQGNRFYMWVSAEGGDMQFAGGSTQVEIEAPFYVGIGVSAHDKDATAKAAFRNLELKTSVPDRGMRYSTVETVLQSGDARVGYVSMERLTAPGWSADGHSLTYIDSGDAQQAAFTPLKTAAPVGLPVKQAAEDPFTYFSKKHAGRQQIWRKSDDGGHPELLTSDDYDNVSPRLSPDGKQVAFLSYERRVRASREGRQMSLRVLSLADKKVKTLSTFTGGKGSLGEEPWSPDGKRLVFVSYQSLK